MTLPALVLQIVLLLLVIPEGNSTPEEVSQNGTSLSPISQPSQIGCMTRPWICGGGELPPRSLCCGDRCVDVGSDINNCGLCQVRCLLNLQCCRGTCTDTNTNFFNCGRCGNVCPVGSVCSVGVCRYGVQPLPPWLFPSPPPPSPLPPKLKPTHPPHKHKQPPQRVIGLY
ncbi:hypothetical protein L6164_029435 [Bauhinia variegata]|uniref:Uncharacterized protein n=1 Tax=Bauhinia variegata TaxID=167791 RepID=A0ACB9L9I1_BAUVA|nr:hypothetical protein L6164_029435 [Bauhinia variegata]